jgi:bacillithiol system protein YtxJ
MIEVKDRQAFDREVEYAHGTYLLFKHSTTCPISARANLEVQKYEKSATLPILQVLVIESRPLSLSIAEDHQVQHASPQVILFKDGKSVWNTSHGHITEANLSDAVERRIPN